MHSIVIVGGGAGGLELATRLGRTLGRRKLALVTLVDRARTHLWKPLLHQVAAGSMDLNDHELDYLYQARWHHFQFRLGRMDGLNRAKKEIHLAPTMDEDGREVIPARTIAYDTLVIAVGSTTNDFGTPGAREHAISLDNPRQAALFHSRLLNACLRLPSVRPRRVANSSPPAPPPTMTNLCGSRFDFCSLVIGMDGPMRPEYRE